MEVILKYNLPEEESEFKFAMNGSNFYSSLWDMDQWLRSELKYNENLTDQEYEIHEKIRSKLHEVMSENDVKF